MARKVRPDKIPSSRRRFATRLKPGVRRWVIQPKLESKKTKFHTILLLVPILLATMLEGLGLHKHNQSTSQGEVIRSPKSASSRCQCRLIGMRPFVYLKQPPAFRLAYRLPSSQEFYLKVTSAWEPNKSVRHVIQFGCVKQ